MSLGKEDYKIVAAQLGIKWQGLRTAVSRFSDAYEFEPQNRGQLRALAIALGESVDINQVLQKDTNSADNPDKSDTKN